MLIDEEDAHIIAGKNVYVASRGYPCISRGRTYKVHRIIMNAPEDKVVDHINGNKLDNRKINLRLCTNRENLMGQKIPRDNKSGFKGVYWYKASKKWMAKIVVNYKTIYLGLFDKVEDAGMAYKNAAKLYFKEY